MEAFSDYVSVGLLDLGGASAMFECGDELAFQVFDFLKVGEGDEWEVVVVVKLGDCGDEG